MLRGVLYGRPRRGAQERQKVELMTNLWAIMHYRLAAYQRWTAASHRLRSLGPGGLWIQDATFDGAPVSDDVFHKCRPYVLNAAMLLSWKVDFDVMAREVKTAVDEWRALLAPKA